MKFTFGGSPGAFVGGSSFTSRGTLTNPTGPSPTFTALSSPTAPNGDTILFSPGEIDWTFAAPLAASRTTAFYLPMNGASTSAGSFNLSFTPVPEPASCLLLAGTTLGVWAAIRRRAWPNTQLDTSRSRCRG